MSPCIMFMLASVIVMPSYFIATVAFAIVVACEKDMPIAGPVIRLTTSSRVKAVNLYGARKNVMSQPIESENGNSVQVTKIHP